MTPTYPTIFGQAPNGVPNPFVPHEHPYPTRFHGPVWTSARFGGKFMQTPAYVHGIGPWPGLSQSPDGLGQDIGITRWAIADAALGALAGYIGAPKQQDAVLYAALGAAVTGIAGRLGLVALLVGLIVENQRKGGLRPELPWG